MMDFLSFTFLARRMESNPVYYDTRPGQVEASLSRMADELFERTDVTQIDEEAPTPPQTTDG